MKIRNGFVSNSSSSSFVIAMSCLDNDQIEAIHNHNEIWQNLPKCIKNIYGLEFDDAWQIEKKGKYLTGYTMMDNFNMKGFFNLIDVCHNRTTWDEGHYWGDPPIEQMIKEKENEN